MDDRPARAECGGGDPAALDAALDLSFLAFVTTLILARYYEERRIF